MKGDLQMKKTITMNPSKLQVTGEVIKFELLPDFEFIIHKIVFSTSSWQVYKPKIFKQWGVTEVQSGYGFPLGFRATTKKQAIENINSFLIDCKNGKTGMNLETVIEGIRMVQLKGA